MKNKMNLALGTFCLAAAPIEGIIVFDPAAKVAVLAFNLFAAGTNLAVFIHAFRESRRQRTLLKWTKEKTT